MTWEHAGLEEPSTLPVVTEAGWGPDGSWRVWIGEGVIDGLIELLDEHLGIPKVIHGPSPEDGIVRGGDLFHRPTAAALGVVPWLNHPDVTDRLERMHCCVVVDKEAAVTAALRKLHENGSSFPAESIPGFDEDIAPVDEKGKPMVVDPSTPWPPRPESIGPVRVWGYTGAGKPLAHTKLLVLGKVAWFKNHAWPEGGPAEYQEFIPELAWFGSANWTIPAARQHLEMGAVTTDHAFVQACLDYVSRVVLESEPLGSTAPTLTPNMQPVRFDDEAFAEYQAEYGNIEEEW